MLAAECDIRGPATQPALLEERLSVQLISIAGFYFLIFVVGVWAGRRRSVDKTTSELLLGSRNIPLFVGALTMTATWVGGGYLNGTAECVYDVSSPQRGLLWAQAPWCYALSLVIGGLFFAGPMRRLGYTTLLDPFNVRYGKAVAAGLFLPALAGEVFWSAAILVALGTTFSVVLGFPLPTSIMISAAIAIAYTVVGGMRSVAYTDVLQLACILIGLGIAIPFALSSTGGLEDLATRYARLMPSFPTGAGLVDLVRHGAVVDPRRHPVAGLFSARAGFARREDRGPAFFRRGYRLRVDGHPGGDHWSNRRHGAGQCVAGRSARESVADSSVRAAILDQPSRGDPRPECGGRRRDVVGRLIDFVGCVNVHVERLSSAAAAPGGAILNCASSCAWRS